MTDTATRPYTYHTDCTHEGTKQARRRCRNSARRGLSALPLATGVYPIAKELALPRRSGMSKGELVYLLSFAPAVRLSFAPVARDTANDS